MNREEQLAIIRRDLPLARNRLSAMLAPDDEIDQLTIARVSAGYDEFGDDSWHKQPYELRQDIREEIADALAYLVFLMRAERRIAHEAAAGRR